MREPSGNPSTSVFPRSSAGPAADGYTTHLVLVNLSPIKATGRVTSRFLKRGRLVDPKYVLSTVGTKPAEVYARLKNDPGIATFKSMDADVPLGRRPRTIEEGTNESRQERGRDLRLRRGERRGVQGSSSVEGEGGQGTGRGRGRGQEGEGEAQPDLPLEGHHPLAPREQDPFDPATEPSLVKISKELADVERELRHLRIKAQGQPTDGGPTGTEQIPDAEKEVSRLEQEYEAEAERVREAKGGGDFVPLAPTAQVSEQLPSAGIFRDGTATEAPKSTKIVRDLREVPKMAKTEMIRARVEPELKSQAEEVFSGLGLERLLSNQPLDPRHRKHRLTGDWSPCWECHIEPDWLLVWDQGDDALILVRTGTHTDLFD